MSVNVHLHLKVSNLEKSRRFYAELFGVEPVKERAGYVKFLPPFAPLNLALSPGRPQPWPGTGDHFGIQLDSSEQVGEHLVRIKSAGLPVREEMNVDCCHANQDKFWVKDPDGIEWEIYHLNSDLPEPRSDLPGQKNLKTITPLCCTPGQTQH